MTVKLKKLGLAELVKVYPNNVGLQNNFHMRECIMENYETQVSDGSTTAGSVKTNKVIVTTIVVVTAIAAAITVVDTTVATTIVVTIVVVTAIAATITVVDTTVATTIVVTIRRRHGHCRRHHRR
jgi:hypothetical protein